ncbi:MAG TPA: hypothetical protein VFD04_10795 [Actinomycetes bacterium]|jgi:hypothetical protein|nr:hypothetical protein [Actinomycetes bacterium]
MSDDVVLGWTPVYPHLRYRLVADAASSGAPARRACQSGASRPERFPAVAGVVSVTQPHDWPFEQPAKGTLRPWYYTAAGYLTVLFEDPDEAERARRDLLASGVPDQDLRLYHAEETLRIASRIQEERSLLAKAFAALVADRTARDRFMGNARAGGSALWVFAPTKERANLLVKRLADRRYLTMRYYGEDGVEDVTGNLG